MARLPHLQPGMSGADRNRVSDPRTASQKKLTSHTAHILYWNQVTVHEHAKCPRCRVPLGRSDTICWACHHVVKAPGMYIKYVWVWMSLKVAVAAVAVVLLLKYKTEVEGVMQAAIRSVLKH